MQLWQRLGVVAGFLGWNVWNVSAFVWSLRSPPLKLTESVELHPPLLLLLACVTIPSTVAISVALFWAQIRTLSRRNRFNALVVELHEARQRICFVGPHRESLIGEHEVLTDQRKLNRLGIPTPPLDDHNKWLAFLAHAMSLATTKDLKGARTLVERLTAFL